MFVPAVVLFLLSSAHCANILGFFVTPSISHQIIFQPIWRELSLRGHNVTVVTTDPLNDPELTNLTEINVGFTYDIFQKSLVKEMSQNVFQSLIGGFRLLDHIVELELNDTKVRQLIANQGNHFDLILIEYYSIALNALVHRFSAPIIGISSMGANIPGYDVMGNPAHPVLYPEFLLSYPTKLSLWQKLTSVAFSLWARYHHHYVRVPQAHKIAKKYIGDNIPYVGNLEKSQSMLFLNVNPLLHAPRPNVPVIIELGQMNIQPVKPLPEDLQDLLDDAVEGVVYFSLGSNVKSAKLEEKVLTNIIGALSELPYTILWKWESDHLPGKPLNVVTRKWFPQQDVLAHPNVRVFVTQGGLQSIEEAISRQVPMVGMPFIADQPKNVQKMIDLEIALGVNPMKMSKEELKNCIQEVAQNNKYKKKIKEVHGVLFDKPMTGLETAVWWSEYVIRHKGARHLRSPTADISWFDYLLMDVIAAVLIILAVSGGVLYFGFTLIMSNLDEDGKVKTN